MSTLQDHRVNIHKSAEGHTANWLEALEEHDGDTIEALNEFFLEVEVLKSRSGTSRVEFLLTCGGPTVRVFVDQWDAVEFHHSWGKDKCGADIQEINLWGQDSKTWVELADYMRELEKDK